MVRVLCARGVACSGRARRRSLPSFRPSLLMCPPTPPSTETVRAHVSALTRMVPETLCIASYSPQFRCECHVRARVQNFPRCSRVSVLKCSSSWFVNPFECRSRYPLIFFLAPASSPHSTPPLCHVLCVAPRVVDACVSSPLSRSWRYSCRTRHAPTPYGWRTPWLSCGAPRMQPPHSRIKNK